MEQEASNQMLLVLNSIESEYNALRNRFIELVQNNKGSNTTPELKGEWKCFYLCLAKIAHIGTLFGGREYFNHFNSINALCKSRHYSKSGMLSLVSFLNGFSSDDILHTGICLPAKKQNLSFYYESDVVGIISTL